MEYSLALIDKAAKMCGGSYYKLSKQWGVPQSRISEYRNRKANVPLKKVPKLAELAGVDPREAYLQVSIEQMPEGSEERDLLGKARAAIVAAMLLFFVVPGLLLPSQSYGKESIEAAATSFATHRRTRRALVRWIATALRFLQNLRFLRNPRSFAAWCARLQVVFQEEGFPG